MHATEKMKIVMMMVGVVLGWVEFWDDDARYGLLDDFK
jgi:hypothetical protein